MAVTKRTRYEVLRRDNHTCRYCGGTAPDVVLTIDHVTPSALGGSDKPNNLVAACKDCNAGKTSVQPGSDLVDDVAQDAVRWAAAIKSANDIRASLRSERAAYVDHFLEVWTNWSYGPDDAPLPRPTNWESSIWKFHEVGLPIDDLREAAHKACSNPKVDVHQMWRYMCGIAWRMLTEIQEMARCDIALDPPKGFGEIS